MSQLIVYSQFNMRKPLLVSSDIADIESNLAAEGVRFEHWDLNLADTMQFNCRDVAENEGVIGQYQHEISKIKDETSFQCVDYVSVVGNANSISLRDKGLSEHTHVEDEVRLFLSGAALVYLHVKERVFIVQCSAGDLIVIPKGTKHWFDMGPNPEYSCFRCYGTDDGLNNLQTGTVVAELAPRWESVLGLPS